MERQHWGIFMVVMALAGACTAPSADNSQRTPGELAAGERLQPLDEIQYEFFGCDDCGDILVEPCRVVQNAETIAIVESTEYAGRDVAKEVMLCRGNDRRTRFVDVVAVAWGETLPEELEVFGSPQHLPAEGYALMGLRRISGHWTSTFSWWVTVGHPQAEVNDQVPLPNRFDDLVVELERVHTTLDTCSHEPIADDDWHERVFSECRIDEPPAHPFGNGCDYVVDHYVFDCDRTVEDALAIGGECDADVIVSTGDGNSQTGAGSITNCYDSLECDVSATKAAAACSMDVDPRCAAVADVMTGCGESESVAFQISQTYCVDVIEDLPQDRAEAYVQCAGALTCDMLLSGFATDECPP